MPKMMLWLLLLNAAEAKKRGKKKIDAFRKKLMILESEFKSKIGNIFVNEKILEEYSI